MSDRIFEPQLLSYVRRRECRMGGTRNRAGRQVGNSGFHGVGGGTDVPDRGVFPTGVGGVGHGTEPSPQAVESSSSQPVPAGRQSGLHEGTIPYPPPGCIQRTTASS